MSKFLTESGWKATMQKFKVADNGLLKALATYERLADDKHQERLNALGSVSSLASKLKTIFTDGIKTAKDQKAKPEVAKNLTEAIKYLGEVEKAAEAERKAIQAAEEKAADAREAAQPPMLDRLIAAAQSMSGAPAGRLRKVMAIAKARGSSWKSLWYYNSHAIFQFVKYDAKQSTREEMTKSGGGKLPFKGDMWVVFPFQKNLDLHCPKGCADKNLVTFLTSMDNDIRTGLDPMFKAQGTEVASAFGPSVNEFIKHVGNLAKDKSHIYSAY